MHPTRDTAPLIHHNLAGGRVMPALGRLAAQKEEIMLVFVSHSQEDSGIYSALCLALDAAPIQRWDPTTMSPSESLATQLREAIRQCQACVFVATRRSIVSRWCLAEVGAFWGAGKKIFLFMGEPDLSDTELPPQFRGSLWTGDARALIEALSKETGTPLPPLAERPGNVFWLGHDLTRAIRIGMFEPNNRDELDKNLRQALYHLDEIAVKVPDARQLLVAALKTHRNKQVLSVEERNELVNAIAKAKNEIGDTITSFQPAFRGYPTVEQMSRLDDELSSK
jgi:TIR domain